MKASRLGRFLLLALTGAGIAFGVACSEKQYAGERSRVIYARQRAVGFRFQLKSPGGKLSSEELRAFVDGVEHRYNDFYKPSKLEEFQVEGRSGVVDFTDIAYEAAMAGYDDVVSLEGDVTGDSFSGRVRIINAANAGPAFDEKFEIERAGVVVVTPDGQQRPAASIEEALWKELSERFSEKYRNPNDFERLGVREGERMEGLEMLADALVQKSGVYGVVGFQNLPRQGMDEAYRYVNYAEDLLQKIRDAYINEKIRVMNVKDTERIQRVSGKLTVLSEITGYYEEEVAISEKDFKVVFEFQDVNDSLQAYFKTALDRSKLEDGLKLYTHKPVTILATYDVGADTGTIFFKVRYSNRKFLAWLKGKPQVVGDTRVLPLGFFNKLMADMYRFRSVLIGVANDFDKRALSKFNLVLQLERRLYGWTQMPVSVFEGKLRPITSMKIQLCNYAPTDVPTAKPNFTQKSKLYALGTPQNVAGKRVPYASVYEFFELDSLYGVDYPKACSGGDAKELYINVGSKGVREKITIQ